LNQDRLPESSMAPRATYRLQFNAGFTFADARRLVPYLAQLGIGSLYASPIFAACPGSTHGYNVTDFRALNPELGTEEEFKVLVAELRRYELGLVVDFVPNHMGICDGANLWWQDVLENGQTSRFATYFDVDWRPLKPELRDKVLLPVLGDQYGVVLERGELDLRLENGAFTVWYFQQPLPIAPPTYPYILKPVLDELNERFAADDPHLLEYQSIITAFERLPANDERDAELVAERQREQIVAKRRLDDLIRAAPAIEQAIAASLARINGTPADPASFDDLDRLLDWQSYRLAFWRTAAEEINYRRFFAINELAAIRQEEPAVFDATHELLLRLIEEGAVNGVRVDHPDGLWDPAGYFAQVQRAASHDVADDAAQGEARSIYLVVEKILEHGEALPADWAVSGTVGYEFARLTTGLFVDQANRKAFDTIYQRFTGRTGKFDDLIYEQKKLIMRVALASEVNVLARALNRLSEQRRTTRDFTLNSLRFALREVIACFPVYRTYVACDGSGVSDRDRRYIEAAVTRAKRRNPASDLATFDFIRDVLLLQYAPDATERQQREQCRFCMKFQQLTGPVMAKGVEDTAFYIYNRLVALNEVGGDPTQFGVGVDEFHRANEDRRRHWPHAMVASSTHDTKRSEDVRARIAVLSEIPRDWRAAINRWARLNRRLKTKVEGEAAPDRNDEYLIYQTLLGAWPFGMDHRRPDEAFVERMVAAMLKAIHEAQMHTSWINPNQAYDDATERFVRVVLDPKSGEAFLADFAVLQRRIAHLGAINSLSQHLLKLTAPGVPDLYQGTEIWDFSLVDPDNRRPVDFAARRSALAALRRRKPSSALARDLLESYQDGRIKLYATLRALAIRGALPDLFACGTYERLAVTGKRAEHVIAFARRHASGEVVVAVPRLVAALAGSGQGQPVGPEAWGDTRVMLPGDGHYRDALTGQIVEVGDDESGLGVGDMFSTLPFTLLVRT
jgi:(1->4)-alpha-D-glucan 1-alpha-D-glucosylmutase